MSLTHEEMTGLYLNRDRAFNRGASKIATGVIAAFTKGGLAQLATED